MAPPRSRAPLGLMMLAAMASAPPPALAAEVQHVTALADFSLLAPCAATAVADAVTSQTYLAGCPTGVDGLQSCICSNSTLSSLVESSARELATNECGLGVTSDENSAADVFTKYCDPEFNPGFSTPTDNIVTDYITDLPQISYLAPCASSVVDSVIMSKMVNRCPKPASLYAPCICGNTGVMSSITVSIGYSARSRCDNGEDDDSAVTFFSEFCNLNDGTSSFSSPEPPPGDMTYHITALPQFSALESCARSGISSAVLRQTEYYCLPGPQALASCVCIKDGMRKRMTSVVSSEVADYCDIMGSGPVVTSAVSLFEMYCDAAEDKTTLSAGESLTDPLSSLATAVNTGGGSDPEETGAGEEADGDGSSAGGSGGSGGSGSSGSSGGSNKTAIIAGSVVGGVVGLAIIAAIAFIVRRRHNRSKAAADAAAGAGAPNSQGGHGGDAPEVQHGHLGVAAGAGLGSEKASTPVYSEMGDHGPAELPQEPSELQGRTSADQRIPFHQRQELDGASVPSAPGDGAARGAAPSSGLGWQSGPVDEYTAGSEPTRQS